MYFAPTHPISSSAVSRIASGLDNRFLSSLETAARMQARKPFTSQLPRPYSFPLRTCGFTASAHAGSKGTVSVWQTRASSAVSSQLPSRDRHQIHFFDPAPIANTDRARVFQASGSNVPPRTRSPADCSSTTRTVSPPGPADNRLAFHRAPHRFRCTAANSRVISSANGWRPSRHHQLAAHRDVADRRAFQRKHDVVQIARRFRRRLRRGHSDPR